MRKILKNQDGIRHRFKARVERFGTKTNYHGFPAPTLLLTDVRFASNNKPATDHIWFTVGKTIEKMELQPGDIIEFDARVGEYVKGYVNHRDWTDERTIDYKLNRPTRIVKVNQN
jgi:hypothetical protein